MDGLGTSWLTASKFVTSPVPSRPIEWISHWLPSETLPLTPALAITPTFQEKLVLVSAVMAQRPLYLGSELPSTITVVPSGHAGRRPPEVVQVAVFDTTAQPLNA